jgi:hypothetical protein
MRPYVDPVPTASNPTTETTGYHDNPDEETPQQKVTRTINEYVKSISNPVEEKKKKDYINANQNLNDFAHVRTNTSNTY